MAEQKGNEINLGDFLRKGEKVLVGRDKGIKARKESNIIEKSQQHDTINIVIPDGLYSVNPSFLEAFLKPVVKKLGKRRFYEKVKFENNKFYNIDTDLAEAVDRIVRENPAHV